MRDLIPVLDAWAADGRRAALCTVVAVHGRAPLPLGASLVVAEDGATAGAVSGGCVEREVVDVAQQVLRGAVPRRLRFAPGADGLTATGLPCGGGIDVWVQAWGTGPLAEEQEAFAAQVRAGEDADLPFRRRVPRGRVRRCARRALGRRGHGRWAVHAHGAGARPADPRRRRPGGRRPRHARADDRPAAPHHRSAPGDRRPRADARRQRAAARLAGCGARRPRPARGARRRDRPQPPARDRRRCAACRPRRWRRRLHRRARLAGRPRGPPGAPAGARRRGAGARPNRRSGRPRSGGWAPGEVALSIAAELVAVRHGRAGARLAHGDEAIHRSPTDTDMGHAGARPTPAAVATAATEQGRSSAAPPASVSRSPAWCSLPAPGGASVARRPPPTGTARRSSPVPCARPRAGCPPGAT